MLKTYIKIFHALIIGLMLSIFATGCSQSNGSSSSSTPKVTLTSIEVTQQSSSIDIQDNPGFIEGTQLQALAIGTYSNGDVKDITNEVVWTAHTPETISVDQTGLITAHQAGPAEVSASMDNVQDLVTGSVVSATLDELKIYGHDGSAIGIDILLTALAKYDNGTVLDVTTQVAWNSSDITIAIVKGDGVVETLKAGDVNITASFEKKTDLHHIRVTDAVIDHIEIQENYVEGGGGKVITNTTQTIELVDDVSYPSDPNGLSPNAYYPTAWAVYTDGRYEYITADAFWWSANQDDAYVNYIKGSFVFGKDINPSVTVSVLWKGLTAEFNVNVVGQSHKTLESIEIKNGWNEELPTIEAATVVVGEETPLVAYGWFVYDDGHKEFEYINANVSWSSSDMETAWINDIVSSYVRGISTGVADITATWQGKSATVKMTVLPDTSPTLVSIFFEKGCGSVQTGEIINDERPLLLTVGQEQCINAWGKYSDESVQRLTTTVLWTADDRDIASMDILQRDSKVTGEGLGSTFVSAIQDGVTGDARVRVIELVSASINGTDEIALGTTAQLKAVATLTDGTDTEDAVVNHKVNWESNNTAVATVDEDGIVTSVAQGIVTITATGKVDTSKTATHLMSVIDAELLSIQIEKNYNPSTPQVITELNVTVDTEEYITAWGIYGDGTRRYINTDAIWWSSDQQIASINFLKSSYVYGRDLGTATVTAYYGGHEASIEVAVVPVDGVTLTSIEIRDGWGSGSSDVTDGSIDIEVGNHAPVVAYGHFSDGSRQDINAKVAWRSDELGVAFILDEFNSNVYGIKVGSADITATWQGVTATVKAQIVASTTPTLVDIEIQKGYVEDGSGEVIDNALNPLVMSVDDIQYVTAWGIYSNNTKEYINTQVIWNSDDNNIASMPILQTSSNVTAQAIGTTTINARLDGVTGTAGVKVQ